MQELNLQQGVRHSTSLPLKHIIENDVLSIILSEIWS